MRFDVQLEYSHVNLGGERCSASLFYAVCVNDQAFRMHSSAIIRLALVSNQAIARLVCWFFSFAAIVMGTRS